MSKKFNQICFYYPTRTLGGVEVAFVRLAKELALKGNRVVFYDYPDGYFSKYFKGDTCIKVLTKKNELASSMVFISTTTLYVDLDDEFDDVIYWQVQKWGGIPHFSYLRSYERLNLLLAKILKSSQFKKWSNFMANNEGAILAMDSNCSSLLEKVVGKKIDILPVPIAINENIYLKSTLKGFNLSWIGRVDLEFKVHILRKILSDFIMIKTDSNFYVIGEGPGKDALADEFSDYCNVIFLGTIQNDCLAEVMIRKSIQMNFAMGMSALESSIIGVPTVCVGFSYTKVERYLYKFIFENERGSLGDQIIKGEQTTGSSFQVILERVIEDGPSISKRTHKYVVENFEISNVTDVLSEKIKLLSGRKANYE